MRSTRALWPVLLLAAPAAAQDAPADPATRWSTGVTLGVPAAGTDADPQLFTLGFVATGFRPRRLGLDLAIGVLPRALVEQALAAGARVGGTIPVRVGPRAWLLPSLGASVVGVAGNDFAEATAGPYLGASALVPGGGRAAFRAGVTWHRFGDARRGIWLYEIGLVRNPIRGD